MFESPHRREATTEQDEDHKKILFNDFIFWFYAEELTARGIKEEIERERSGTIITCWILEVKKRRAWELENEKNWTERLGHRNDYWWWWWFLRENQLCWVYNTWRTECMEHSTTLRKTWKWVYFVGSKNRIFLMKKNGKSEIFKSLQALQKQLLSLAIDIWKLYLRIKHFVRLLASIAVSLMTQRGAPIQKRKQPKNLVAKIIERHDKKTWFY